MAKFKKGDLVSFKRNRIIFSEKTEIIFAVPSIEEEQENPVYIIENENGWIPDQSRKKRFSLDKEKKYLFVQEEELKKYK